jgi:hypothetical protein
MSFCSAGMTCSGNLDEGRPAIRPAFSSVDRAQEKGVDYELRYVEDNPGLQEEYAILTPPLFPFRTSLPVSPGSAGLVMPDQRNQP